MITTSSRPLTVFCRSIMAANLILLIILSTTFAPGCRNKKPGPGDSAGKVLRLATTTSTVQSGLFDVLIPLFEYKYKVKVRLSAAGSGAAMQLAKDAEADVVLVHAPQAEEAFITAGYGINRADVMYNDLIIVGPPDDPYGIKEEKGVLEALKKIVQQKATFISRGDNSGTHIREVELWNLLDVEPHGNWYVAVKKGMFETLQMASEQNAYTLADRSTYLFNRDELNLIIVNEGDPLLLNTYSVIAVNPAVIKNANLQAAMQFIDFVTSVEGQEIIAGYGRLKFGKSLFTPLAIPQD